MRADPAHLPSTSGRAHACVNRARSRITRARTIARASGDDVDDAARARFASVNFHGVSPEDKASAALCDLLTMSAVRVVIDQMSGSRHRSPMAPKLIDYLQQKPLRAGASAWLAELMAHEDLDHRAVALRIIETRKVLAATREGFDYDWMREETLEGLARENLELSRALAGSSFGDAPES